MRTEDKKERIIVETRRAFGRQHPRGFRKGANVRTRSPRIDPSQLLLAVVGTILVCLLTIVRAEGACVRRSQSGRSISCVVVVVECWKHQSAMIFSHDI